MFKGIKPKTFLNTHQEWHSFLIGFFEVLCPWRPRIPILLPSYQAVSGEYHYYMAGRGVGFPVLLLILIGIAKLIKEVFL